MLLSVSIAALSCSADLPHDEIMIKDGESKTIIVSGAVSDKISGEALVGIQIHFRAVENTGKEEIIHTKKGYTNREGLFTITAGDFYYPATCTITAEDPNGIYKSEQQELNISWHSTSYDEYNNCFYVNECDFYMITKEK